MEALNAALAWLEKNAGSLQLLGPAVAAVAFAGWTVFRYFEDRKQARAASTPALEPFAQTGPVGAILEMFAQSIQQQEKKLRDEIRREQPGSERFSELERKLAAVEFESAQRKARLDQLEQRLAELKQELVPQDLDANLFPPALDVRAFVRGQELVVNYHPTRAEWIGAVVGYTILIAFFFLGPLLGQNRGLALMLLVPAVWFAYHRCRRGWFVKFDLRKQAIKISSPTSYQTTSVIAPIRLVTRQIGAAWEAEAQCAPAVGLVRSSRRSSEAEANAELLPFVAALNWEMGVPILAHGFFTKAKSRS